jgi:DNA-binding IclR family transcriptional regulator
MANYGNGERPGDVVPDWLLGGNRKRRVLQALAEERADGWTAAQLSEQVGCGRTTAHEILRSLRALGLLEVRPGGGVLLDSHGQLAQALRELLAALEPLERQVVERPPRRRGRT